MIIQKMIIDGCENG